jgi:hypothetical protein
VIVVVGATLGVLARRSSAPLETDDLPIQQLASDRFGEVDDLDLPLVARTISELWNGVATESIKDVAIFFSRQAGPILVAAYTKGRLPAEVWSNAEESTFREFAHAIQKVRNEIPDERRGDIDALHLSLTHSYREISFESLLVYDKSYAERGRVGLEIAHKQATVRFSPGQLISANRGLRHAIDEFRREYHLLEEELWWPSIRYRLFEAEEILVELGPDPRARLLVRGNEVVDVRGVTRSSLENFASLAAGYLTEHVHEDGRLTYRYRPSTLDESDPDVNNMIRQWMATVALIRYAEYHADERIRRLAERNIDYNLAHFYHNEGALGVIEWDQKVKLGAVALAAIALIEHPNRAKWAEEELSLRHTIDSLWHEDGFFSTFLKPSGRNDNQNFYPGEALLLWALLYEREQDSELLERFMTSFRYYRAWHLNPRNRNPAFIPWHTQAYFIVWQLTGDEALRDFVFEMNDWLLDMQQWEEATYEDERGRFYDPERPFGPPHASSTGVYIEGLIDAYRMAKETGDKSRSEAYRVALVRAMRSLLQLQFVDDVDLYYIPESERRYVRGGLRTTVYNNEIRIDNVQHPLMGILKVLRTFEDDDYLVSAFAGVE